MLVPKLDQSHVDTDVALVFFGLYIIYPLIAASFRRLAQHLCGQTRTSQTVQSFFFDTSRTMLGLPTTLKLTTGIDHFLLIFTLLLAMFIDSTINLYLFKVQLLSVRYAFSTVDDVIRSQIPIYALDSQDGLPNMCWLLKGSPIIRIKLARMMHLLYKDNKNAAIVLSMDSLEFIQRHYGISQTSFRMLPTHIGHRFASYSISTGAIRLADHLKYNLLRTREFGFDRFYGGCNTLLNYKEWLKDKQQLETEAESRRRGLGFIDSFMNLVLSGHLMAIVVFLWEYMSTKCVRALTDQLCVRVKMYLIRIIE